MLIKGSDINSQWWLYSPQPLRTQHRAAHPVLQPALSGGEEVLTTGHDLGTALRVLGRGRRRKRRLFYKHICH